MSAEKQLLPLRQFQEKARVNFNAVKALEKMGFVTPYVVKTSEWFDYYYPRDEAKIIRMMQEFLTGDHGPINLKKAHRMAVDAINSET